jgi:hypothetical protein
MLRLSLPALASHVAAGNVGATRRPPSPRSLPDVNGCAIDQTLPAERRSRQRFCARALAARRALQVGHSVDATFRVDATGCVDTTTPTALATFCHSFKTSNADHVK